MAYANGKLQARPVQLSKALPSGTKKKIVTIKKSNKKKK